MNLIEKIRKPIEKEIEQFEKSMTEELQTENPLLKNISNYLQLGKGKQLRPILVILSAKLCGEVTESTIYGAISLELIHTASLIHDDVVDNTFQRRGQPSINAQWNNKVAILVGDHILSKSLSSGIKADNIKILETIANVGMNLTDGELLQLDKVQHAQISEEDYLEIIQKKTALLFSSCALIGGLSVKADKNTLKHLYHFGEYAGICFQMKDDLLDYSENNEIGKPTRNDIKDGKITLPLIYALKNATNHQKHEIEQWIENSDFSDLHIEKIVQFVQENGGLEYTLQKMEEYKNKAIEELNGFADGELKQSMILFAEFMSNRDY
ncbi:MAG: polyprenyl synthetase family protein [Paludibacteraceae bacterium]|jgi:octaprenyl-diphosphate synthase|nr:polyprenyl synthetase family protein [Paludibacteraceae bacterium]OPZ03294.1 MAG: Octaprenyl-diphosphate synthase [Bacteroidetes bacterium ADurb.BinA395]HOF98430.1 polyprenyl synthetase family protein [Paludibacteraceae bacterium]